MTVRETTPGPVRPVTTISRGFSVVGLVLLLPIGCQRLTATTSAVSLLNATPDLSSAEGYAGSGLAAAVGPLLSSLEIQPAVTAFVSLGQREHAISTARPTPISDARISISWFERQVALCPLADPPNSGAYFTDNISAAIDCGNESLQYVVGDDYLTEIETRTDFYSLSVTAPAPVDAAKVSFSAMDPVTNFHGATLPRHALSTPLDIDWGGDEKMADRQAFVTLSRIRYVGGDGEADALSSDSWLADPAVLFDNIPTETGEMIQLAEGDPVTHVEIPASVFDAPGAYFLIITATQLSERISTNLFLGSRAMAGAGRAFLFLVD